MSQDPQPPSKQSQQRDAAVIAAITALILVGASTGALTQKIRILLEPFGITAAVAAAVVRMALRIPITPKLPPGGVALAAAPALETQFRSAYILQASRRVQQAMREGKSLDVALREEQRNLQLHLSAQSNRVVMAKRVDEAASKYGSLLGWYATLDGRTSPECRQANGKNFRVDERPAIGYPGAVHPHCRCKVGKPHASGALLSGRKVA